MSHDKLNELFDVDPALLIPEVCEPEQSLAIIEETPTDIQVLPVVGLPKLDIDVEYARQNIVDVIDKVKQAMDTAILVAQSGDSPRAFEVVATMLTAVVDANRELVDLHRAKEVALDTNQKRLGMTSGGENTGDINIEKAVFVGSPSELIRELREMQKKDAAAKS